MNGRRKGSPDAWNASWWYIWPMIGIAISPQTEGSTSDIVQESDHNKDNYLTQTLHKVIPPFGCSRASSN